MTDEQTLALRLEWDEARLLAKLLAELGENPDHIRKLEAERSLMAWERVRINQKERNYAWTNTIS